MHIKITVGHDGSVAKTGRLVIVDNSHRVGSVASEVSSLVAEEGFDSLRRPIVRLTAPQIHVPYNQKLEKQLFPTKDIIAAAIRRIM